MRVLSVVGYFTVRRNVLTNPKRGKVSVFVIILIVAENSLEKIAIFNIVSITAQGCVQT